MVNLNELQEKIYQNKVDKGFNLTNIPQEFCYLHGEVTEAFEAWLKEKGKDKIALELADVTIFALGIAQMLGVSLEKAVLEKIDTNSKRIYINDQKSKIEPKLMSLDKNRFNLDHIKNKQLSVEGEIKNENN